MSGADAECCYDCSSRKGCSAAPARGLNNLDPAGGTAAVVERLRVRQWESSTPELREALDGDVLAAIEGWRRAAREAESGIAGFL
ncbi:hypothetical protein [Streptomyces oceani]|uniref:Uncharacterized protein n=1 Tax=Streptomyces oceani TaxID=1075402 RepID=A0A1E7KJR2_9ACTN|nr:hypothetical protein [Streptomyces oceani]OEV04084.1 hypothetical protein AN216_07565 [Streptomyces oceani]